MNDYWNDPPEELEPPYCDKCEEFMTVSDDGLSAKCPVCADEWKAPPDQDFPEQSDVELPDDYLKG